MFKIVIAVLLSLFIVGCDKAPSNVKTLQTTNCGVDWVVIQPGQRIPGTIGTCSYNTVLPDYPMQGDAEFLTQYKGNILVKIKVGYDYEIIDGIKFLKVAKFLGKQSSSAANAASSTNMSQFEIAENVVIDIVLREMVTSKTLDLDIVEFNPAKFEDHLFKVANEKLVERGVRINSMMFVTIVEDQTRMAIDAATAMSVYRSKDMETLGKALVIARAGATQVHVHTAKKD